MVEGGITSLLPVGGESQNRRKEEALFCSWAGVVQSPHWVLAVITLTEGTGVALCYCSPSSPNVQGWAHYCWTVAEVLALHQVFSDTPQWGGEGLPHYHPSGSGSLVFSNDLHWQRVGAGSVFTSEMKVSAPYLLWHHSVRSVEVPCHSLVKVEI